MKSVQVASLLAVALSYVQPTVAAPAAVCNSGIYKDLLFLANYPPAQKFCSEHFPVPAVTTTLAPGKVKRGDVSTTSVASTVTNTALASAVLAKCTESSAQNVVSTACSCIEVPKTVRFCTFRQWAFRG